MPQSSANTSKMPTQSFSLICKLIIAYHSEEDKNSYHFDKFQNLLKS